MSEEGAERKKGCWDFLCGKNIIESILDQSDKADEINETQMPGVHNFSHVKNILKKNTKSNYFLVFSFIQFLFCCGWTIMIITDILYWDNTNNKSHFLDFLGNEYQPWLYNQLIAYLFQIIIYNAFFLYFCIHSVLEENKYLVVIGCSASFIFYFLRIITFFVYFPFWPYLVLVVQAIIFFPIHLITGYITIKSFGNKELNITQGKSKVTTRYNNYMLGEASLLIDIMASTSAVFLVLWFIEYSWYTLALIIIYLIFSWVFCFSYIFYFFHMQSRTFGFIYFCFLAYFGLYVLYKLFMVFSGIQMEDLHPSYDDSETETLWALLVNLSIIAFVALLIRLWCCIWLVYTLVLFYDEILTEKMYKKKPPLEFWYYMLGITREELEKAKEKKKVEKEKARKLKMRMKEEKKMKKRRMEEEREARLKARGVKIKKKRTWKWWKRKEKVESKKEKNEIEMKDMEKKDEEKEKKKEIVLEIKEIEEKNEKNIENEDGENGEKKEEDGEKVEISEK